MKENEIKWERYWNLRMKTRKYEYFVRIFGGDAVERYTCRNYCRPTPLASWCHKEANGGGWLFRHQLSYKFLFPIPTFYLWRMIHSWRTNWIIVIKLLIMSLAKLLSSIKCESMGILWIWDYFVYEEERLQADVQN